MSDNLVLASSFFNISGGRRQDSSDTFRAIPSIQTHSGDEAGLYAVSEASTPGPMGARARRMALDVLQNEYSSAFDLPPGQRLKAAVQAAHRELQGEFKGHVRVGLTAIVAEGPSLYLAQVPPAQAYVLHSHDLHSVAAEEPEPESPFGHALGAPGELEASLFRDVMDASDVVMLCSSWFARDLDLNQLQTAFAKGGAHQITERLFDAARAQSARDATCVALEAVNYEATSAAATNGAEPSDPLTLLDHFDEAAASVTYLWNRVAGELLPGRAQESRGGFSRSISPAPLKGNAPDGGVGSAEQYNHESPTAQESAFQGSGPPFIMSEHGTEELPIVSHDSSLSGAAGAGSGNTELDDVNSFIEKTIDIGRVTPPVQGFSDPNVAPERIYPGQSARRPQGRSRRFADMLNLKAGSPTRTPISRPAGSPATRPVNLASVPRAMWLWAGAALAVVALFIILAVTLGGSGGTAGPDYIHRARTFAVKADETQVTALKAQYLATARKNIRLAAKHGATARRITSIKLYVRHISDAIYGIVRLKAPQIARVATFDDHPSGPVELSAGSPALFLLSFGRHQLFLLDHPGKQKVARQWVTPGYLVSWHQPVSLSAAGNTLLALDTQNDLLTFTPGISTQGTIQALVSPSTAMRVAATASYDTGYGTNFYILDSANGQVWRYAGGAATASGWLTKAQPSVLSSAVSMAIDGDIYVGLRDGKVLKYVAGSPVAYHMLLPFALNHISEIYTQPNLPYLFILDNNSGRLVEVGKRGKYIRTLVLPSAVQKHLGQFTVSSDGHTIYFTSGGTIDSIPVTG